MFLFRKSTKYSHLPLTQVLLGVLEFPPSFSSIFIYPITRTFSYRAAAQSSRPGCQHWNGHTNVLVYERKTSWLETPSRLTSCIQLSGLTLAGRAVILQNCPSVRDCCRMFLRGYIHAVFGRNSQKWCALFSASYQEAHDMISPITGGDRPLG